MRQQKRIQVRQGLLLNEQSLQVLVETIPALVWRAKPNGHIDYVNKRLLEYFGSPLEEIIGWGWMQKAHPDDVGFKGVCVSAIPPSGIANSARHRRPPKGRALDVFGVQGRGASLTSSFAVARAILHPASIRRLPEMDMSKALVAPSTIRWNGPASAPPAPSPMATSFRCRRSGAG